MNTGIILCRTLDMILLTYKYATNFANSNRTTRESTPPSLIKGSDVVSTPPGSSTRRTGYAFSHRRIWNSVKDMPITHEVDELFASSEQEQTQYFTEKYVRNIITAFAY